MEQDDLFGIGAYGAYRYNDPDTSKEAAESVNATRLEGLWLEALTEYPKGLTSEEVANIKGLELGSSTPRAASLVKKGKIYRTNEKRPGKSGHLRYVWKLS